MALVALHLLWPCGGDEAGLVAYYVTLQEKGFAERGELVLGVTICPDPADTGRFGLSLSIHASENPEEESFINVPNVKLMRWK